MAYQPTTWKNNETKLNADNMNNLERGITEVENNITSVETSINNLNTKTNTLTSKVTALEEADDTLNEKVTSLTNTSSDLTKKYNTLNDDGANAVMERGLTEMCRFARRNAPNARVVLIGAWYGTTERQKKLLNASKNSGVMFVDIWDLHVEENQANVGDTITFTDGSTQKVQDTGDASHPSSKGMKLIADRIIEKCFNV